MEINQYSKVKGKELSSFVAMLHSNFHICALSLLSVLPLLSRVSYIFFLMQSEAISSFSF